jgi:putative FmdB family regulatory protein|tara:strand:+ start:106 stop:366 length:261 start_codon:yes stop_codon:yes gene_type:complete
MPRYKYSCSLCDEEFIVMHSWSEIQETCIKCGHDEINKLISTPHLAKNKQPEKKKIGQATREYIEANREILEQQKQDENREDYEPS